MLFWIESDLDFSRLPDPATALREEAAALREWHASRRLLRCWRRVNGRGLHAVLEFASAEALDDAINGLPTYRALQGLNITALAPHRRFPQFSQWLAEPGLAHAPLYHVRLEIDRARLQPALTPELMERAEGNAHRHIAEGQVVGIWRHPHGNAASMAWCVRDNAELHRELATLPIGPWLRGIHAEPMVPHPELPELAGWTR